ncbi:MAG: hypothetical protein ABIW36_09145 [Terrimesophilobacter sp.]
MYLLIGIVGVVELGLGDLMGWMVVGSSGALIALRILIVWLRRRQAELAASEAARRAEPGYVAPIIDPAELSRRRTRYVKIVVLGFVGPFIAVEIGATWVALVSSSGLQAFAVGMALATFLSAGATLLGLRRGLKKIRDNG